MAFIAEQAGGAATDGMRRILDIVPDRRCTSGRRWSSARREDVDFVAETIRERWAKSAG